MLRAPKSDSEEIILYVGNREIDTQRSIVDQTGDLSAPFSDIAHAFKVATVKAAAYSANQDGSEIKIRIALFKGDHYMIKRNFPLIPGNSGDGWKNFKLIIR